MSTQAQILANRENSQKSTGPVTEEGKETSSRNNTKHGLAAKLFTNRTFFLFANEDGEEFSQLVDSFIKEYSAKDPSEQVLCRRMAQHEWLRARASRLQTACFDQNFAVCDEKNFALYCRYESTQARLFHQCLNDLLKIRAAKEKSQTGFEAQLMKAASAVWAQNGEKQSGNPFSRRLSGNNFNIARQPTAPPAENTAETAAEPDSGGAAQAA